MKKINEMVECFIETMIKLRLKPAGGTGSRWKETKETGNYLILYILPSV